MEKGGKVIISHLGALKSKYPDRHAELLSAVENLTKADAARGLETRLVCIDQDIMRRLGGRISSRTGLCSVEDAEQQREAKEAVDLIASSLSPVYIAILDGPDVIPHITLDNPNARHDFEGFVNSDLPYASDTGYSRNVSDFLNVTRSVARIPNVPGTNDPNPVIRCLNTAANFQSHPLSEYLNPFALCAPEFERSTEQSIRTIFGKAAKLDVVPPAGPSNTSARFSNRSHFINYHGLADTPSFYGGPGSSHQAAVAMTSSQVAAKLVEGVLVVSECCFGAQLFNPKNARGAVPICVSYLAGGCLGFLGSTNFAFGGIGEWVGADVLATFFFQKALGG